MTLPDLADRLLPWFRQQAREMPWRGCGDPWGILVSEVMLQQTQVATVVPYWQAFMATFPDPAALARAGEAEVMKAWEGLGYYRRARMLQRTARALMDHHGGQLPRTAKALEALPGIGPYTAGAVASLAFGEAVPAVDGNVLRVWSRWQGSREPIDLPRTRDRCAASLQPLIPVAAAGPFNESLMELGATVCTPRAPACGGCPIAGDCVAREDGSQALLPVKAGKIRVRSVVSVQLVLLGPRGAWLTKGPEEGLLAGLVALPSQWIDMAHPARSADLAPAPVLEALVILQTGLDASRAGARLLRRFPFRFTHLHADFWVYCLAWEDPERDPPGEGRWVSVEALSDLPWPTALRPVRDALSMQS
ncbi:MAG: A/G-specific adenine glycosylase [Candidatus Sericytochromatia bacterium]|nr:A/G-specific adenine glycosylase [Candidatus Tanganyikabacteria bacterium]